MNRYRVNYDLMVAIKQKFGSQINFSKEVGLDKVQVSQIINGWRIPTPQQRERISKALGRAEDDLFMPLPKCGQP